MFLMCGFDIEMFDNQNSWRHLTDKHKSQHDSKDVQIVMKTILSAVFVVINFNKIILNFQFTAVQISIKFKSTTSFQELVNIINLI